MEIIQEVEFATIDPMSRLIELTNELQKRQRRARRIVWAKRAVKATCVVVGVSLLVDAFANTDEVEETN